MLEVRAAWSSLDDMLGFWLEFHAELHQPMAYK